MNEVEVNLPFWRSAGMISFKVNSDRLTDWDEDLISIGFKKISDGNRNLIDQQMESVGFSINIYYNVKTDNHYIDLWGPYTSILSFITRNENEKMECLLSFSKLICNFRMISDSYQKQDARDEMYLEQKGRT